MDFDCTLSNCRRIRYRFWNWHANLIGRCRTDNLSINMDRRGLHHHVCSFTRAVCSCPIMSNRSSSTFQDPSTTLACVSTTITPASVTACACPDKTIYEQLSGGTGPCDYTSGQSDLEEAIFLSCPSIDGGPATAGPTAVRDIS